MLTRLRVQGFKNLADAEVAFGPFTCIAGGNGVGKSNLFDAIQFLRDLTEFPIIEAAARVRDPVGRTGDIRGIFTQNTSGRSDTIRFEADFIVPKQVRDDFNREAEPTATFLTYALELRYVPSEGSKQERIDLSEESLTYIPAYDAKPRLGFLHARPFRESLIHNKRRGASYISTDSSSGRTVIKLHQDGGSSGRPFQVPAEGLPKTIVGGINTNDYPTVLAARREMQSWTLLQLEPSALRQSDNYSAEPRVAANGAHLPATLQRLDAQAEISNQLAELLDDVGSVTVDKDDSRRTLTLGVVGRNGVTHPARSLSDGTLRFLALAVLAADPASGRLLCLEEPENGIHPSRIPAILNLLQQMAVDTNAPADEDNPLKQVIINTHSPAVVSALSIDDLVVASLIRQAGASQAVFDCVEGSWRATWDTTALPIKPPSIVAKGVMLDYINTAPDPLEREPSKTAHPPRKTVRQYATEQWALDFSGVRPE